MLLNSYNKIHVIVLFFTISFTLFLHNDTSASNHLNEKSCTSIELPLSFDSHGLPLVELKINSQKITALLDLGSSSGLHLPIATLNKISNSQYTGEKRKSLDLTGIVREEKIFMISSLNIKCMTFTNITGVELKPWGLSIGKEDNNQKEEQAVIGRGIFDGRKISIEFENKKLIIKDVDRKIKTNNKSNRISFVMNKEGITIPVLTENFSYQMVLDTGASVSIIVANKVKKGEKIKPCEMDLGPDMKCRQIDSKLNIYGLVFKSQPLLIPIDQRFKVGGLLGRDFFKQFVVELNFMNNTIMLTPSLKH